MKLSHRNVWYFDESRGNCCERERCWTRMVGVYSVSRRRWDVNFEHQLSCTGPLEGVLRQRKNLCDRKVRFPPCAAIFAWPLSWTILGLAHTLVAHIMNSNPPNYRTKRTAPSFCKQTFVHGKVASPKNIAGDTTASNNFSRKTAKIMFVPQINILKFVASNL